MSFNTNVVEHGITEQLSLEGLSCPTCLLKQDKESCQGPCSGSFWVPQRMESPQPPCAPCASSQSPSHWESVSWCSDWSSCFSVNAHCFMSHHWDHWAPLGTERLGSWTVSRMMTPQPPWATYSGAQSAQSKKKALLMWTVPCFSLSPLFLCLSLATIKKILVSFPYTLPSDIYAHWRNHLEFSPPPSWTVLFL